MLPLLARLLLVVEKKKNTFETSPKKITTQFSLFFIRSKLWHLGVKTQNGHVFELLANAAPAQCSCSVFSDGTSAPLGR